jgi:hypothetical protein
MMKLVRTTFFKTKVKQILSQKIIRPFYISERMIHDPKKR